MSFLHKAYLARNERLPEVGFPLLGIDMNTSDGFSSLSDVLRKNESINHNYFKLNNKILNQLIQQVHQFWRITPLITPLNPSSF